MRELKTEIEINATPSVIWDILTDFEDYVNWNPFIISVEGKLKPRNRLQISIHPPGGNTQKFKPRVNFLKQLETFSWIGHLFMVGLFDGHHIFELKPIDNQTTRFIHREEFSGLLVTLLWKKVQTSVKAGFEAMNQAIKVKAEQN